jgi:hypothetical protein
LVVDICAPRTCFFLPPDGNAHDLSSQNQRETYMDQFNNQVGRQIGEWAAFRYGSTLTDEIKNIVWQTLQTGGLIRSLTDPKMPSEADLPVVGCQVTTGLTCP